MCLIFRKIESGKMVLDPHEFSLRDCIENLLNVFSNKIVQSDVELLYDIDNKVPVNVIGDSMRLRQVLINLIGNVTKFTPKGEVFLGVLLKKQDQQDIGLEFEVADTGIGVPAEKLSRLFEPFAQADSATARKYGGTGLGLLICKQMVNLMGGDITVQSQPGKGTTFKFTIKCGFNHQTDVAVSKINMSPAKGLQMLVVDDNKSSLRLLCRQLELWNINATGITTVDEALSLLSKGQHFDLVITDSGLAETGEMKLLAAIKAVNNAIPVILLSQGGKDRGKNSQGEFSTILSRPVKQQALANTLLTALKLYEEIEKKPEPMLQKEFALTYPLKIIVAEDNKVNQMLILKILDRLGYKPALAENGLEVIRLLEQQSCDLVLMDMEMPEMDGITATRHIRKSNSSRPRIVAMTANAMVEHRAECYNAGMNGFISKPIIIDDLLRLLQQHTDKL
jgi:CheY-like chemotaxis protein